MTEGGRAECVSRTSRVGTTVEEGFGKGRRGWTTQRRIYGTVVGCRRGTTIYVASKCCNNRKK